MRLLILSLAVLLFVGCGQSCPVGPNEVDEHVPMSMDGLWLATHAIWSEESQSYPFGAGDVWGVQGGLIYRAAYLSSNYSSSEPQPYGQMFYEGVDLGSTIEVVEGDSSVVSVCEFTYVSYDSVAFEGNYTVGAPSLDKLICYKIPSFYVKEEEKELGYRATELDGMWRLVRRYYDAQGHFITNEDEYVGVYNKTIYRLNYHADTSTEVIGSVECGWPASESWVKFIFDDSLAIYQGEFTGFTGSISGAEGDFFINAPIIKEGTFWARKIPSHY